MNGIAQINRHAYLLLFVTSEVEDTQYNDQAAISNERHIFFLVVFFFCIPLIVETIDRCFG